MAVSSSILISAPPKETPFLAANGRVSDPWLAWLQSVTKAGVVVQQIQQQQIIAEDNSTDGNNGTVAADILDAMALSAEPVRRPVDVDDFSFSSNVRPPEDGFDATLPPKSWGAELDELRALITAGEATPFAATVSAGRGVTGTITIPKLTTANGSITVVDGIITAFTNPT